MRCNLSDLSASALGDELSPTIHAKYVPFPSASDVGVCLADLWGNPFIDDLATLGATPDRCGGPPMIEVGAVRRFHSGSR